jgi:hypothetical protein
MLLAWADDVLRGRAVAPEEGARPQSLGLLLAVLVAYGMLYGAVMGGYGGFADDGMLQMLYSALKVPLLLTVTFALSLPPFFVINTLLGLRDDFAQALRSLMAAQAALTIVLASLAPVTAFWYFSYRDYPTAVFFNFVVFAAATILAQRVLRGHYQILIARCPRHRVMLNAWLVVYGFVGVQMGWVLRPFVGDPNMPAAFFRSEAWSNAYVNLAQLIWGVLS